MGKKFNKVLTSVYETYDRLKDDFGLVDLDLLIKEINVKMSITKKEFMVLLEVGKDQSMIKYSLVAGRELQDIKIVKGDKFGSI